MVPGLYSTQMQIGKPGINFVQCLIIFMIIEPHILTVYDVNKMYLVFVCLFVLLLYVPSQQLRHCGTVSSPNHTFSWAGLNKRITSNSCTYFRL